MNLISKIIKEYQTGQRKGMIEPVLLTSYQETPGDSMRHNGYTYQDEYRLSLKVEVTYWANAAEHRSGRFRKQAERVMLNELYGTSLSLVDLAILMIQTGRSNEAVKELLKLRDGLIGND